VQNIKSCFREILSDDDASSIEMPGILLDTQSGPASLVEEVWTLRLSSSLDSDRNRCRVRGGADGWLSRNERHYSASVDPK